MTKDTSLPPDAQVHDPENDWWRVFWLGAFVGLGLVWTGTYFGSVWSADPPAVLDVGPVVTAIGGLVSGFGALKLRRRALEVTRYGLVAFGLVIGYFAGGWT